MSGSSRAPRLVSAGAGSGKTHRIVEEVVSRVRAGTSIERIAAVTFTDAAASELQERLRARLLAADLADEAARVERATICTIHSFALKLLTRFPLAAGVSPTPLALDAGGAAVLFERALDADLLEVASDERSRWLEESFGRGVGLSSSEFDPAKRPEGRLRAVVRAIVEKGRSLAMSPEDLAEEGARAVERLEALLPEVRDALTLERALASAHLDAMRWLDENPEAPYKADLALHELLRARRAQPYESALDYAIEVLRAGGGKRTLAALGALVTASQDITEAHPELRRRVVSALRGSYACAARVLRGYQSEKSRLGAVDFEDMQVRAHALLTGAIEGVSAYAPLVAAQLPVIVVDEFQDTSPLQYVLFDALRAAGAELTLVGDLKQGIYGFRSADSTLFAALLSRGEALETLPCSRRSRAELVGFANAMFSRLLPSVGVRFDPLEAENAYTRTPPPTKAPCVDVLWHGSPSQASSRVEAGVARLVSLLAERREVLDRRTGSWRAMRADDVAVLAFDHAHLARWADALRALGIPAALDAADPFDSLEVKLARAWFAMIASPRDRAAAAIVLVSELYGVSQRTMVRLTLQRVSGSPQRALALAAEDPESLPLTPFERRALQRCADDLAWCRAALRQQPLAQAVEASIERVELEARLSLRLDASGVEALRANLAALVAVAHSITAQRDAALSLVGVSGATLEDLLDLWERTARTSARRSGAGGEGVGAVRLVTLHGSKGMEYPVVILDALARKVSERLPRVEVLRPRDPETLLGPGALRESGVQLIPEVGVASWSERLAASFDADARARAEWLRLLYVAVTRAREHLVILWPDAAKGSSTFVASLIRDHLPAPPAGTPGGAVHEWLGTAVRSFSFASTAAQDAPEPPPPDLSGWRRMVEDEAECAIDLTAPQAHRTLGRVSPSELCQVNDCPEVLRIARFVRGDRHEIARGGDGGGATSRAIPSTWRSRTAIPRELAASRVGTLVHAAVERATLMDAGGLAALRDPVLASEVLAANGQLDHLPELVALIVETLGSLREAVRSLGCREEPVREIPFAIELAGSPLTGIIDLVVPTPEGLHVIDLKTHPLRATEVSRWAEYYAPQLDAYALALATLTGEPVVGRHLAIPAAGSLVTLPGGFDPPSARGALSMLAQRIADGVRGPSQDCTSCGWRDICRVGRERMERRATQ